MLDCVCERESTHVSADGKTNIVDHSLSFGPDTLCLFVRSDCCKGQIDGMREAQESIRVLYRSCIILGMGAWHHAAFKKPSKKTPHPLCHTTTSSVSKPDGGRSLLTKQTDHRGEPITYFSSTARDGCAPLQQNLWEHRSALYRKARFILMDAGAASAVASGENRQINKKRGQNSRLGFIRGVMYEEGMEEEDDDEEDL